MPGSRGILCPNNGRSRGHSVEARCILGERTKSSRLDNQSRHAARVLLARKEDEMSRTCADYCALNKTNVKSVYLASTPSDSGNALGGANGRPQMALCPGRYYVGSITERDKPRMALSTEFGWPGWKDLVPLGSVNAPGVFPPDMQAPFEDLLGLRSSSVQASFCLLRLDCGTQGSRM